MNVFPKVKKGRIFVISAPSGTGKTTLVNDILTLYPDNLVRSISCTTREPRVGEKDGIDYHFVTKEQFQDYEKNGEFLESAKIYDYDYGTLKGEVKEIQEKGKNALLVIDVQGASQVREKIEAIYIFICPPSHQELERRIRNRKQDAPSMIEKRLKRADEEIKERYHYDYILVNDDEKTAVEVLKSIFIAECYKNEEKYEQAEN